MPVNERFHFVRTYIEPRIIAITLNPGSVTLTARDHLEDLMRRFGETIDEPLTFNEEGTCIFPVGEDRECLVSIPQDADAALFCVNVAPVLMHQPEPLFRHLLTLNFTDELTEGATLGLTADGEEIVVRYTKDATALHHTDIERVIGNLVHLAERLDTTLTDWQRSQHVTSSAPEADRDEDPARPAFHFPNYA